LSEYRVIHDMLLLREFDVFLLMGSAIVVAAPMLLILERRHWQAPVTHEAMAVQRLPVTKRAVAGAAVFGSGWALAGTCPVPALAMIASGSGLGVFVAAGLFSGIALRDSIDRKAVTPAPEC
jgi:uncharacterized membrane protein YedE/YeeE